MNAHTIQDHAVSSERRVRTATAARQRLVRELIARGVIRSQGELLSQLAARGHQVTQATLSRDLKLLKVGKLPDGRGGYSYAFRDERDHSGSDPRLQDTFLYGFRSIAFSANLAVIRTLPGHGSSVAFALDKLEVAEILGTVAGDDTILAVLAEGTTAAAAQRALSRRLPALAEQDS